jgi:SAM-dependent methyltransferase
LSAARSELSAAALREEIIRLGPWHFEIQITPEISTRVAAEAEDVTYPEAFGKVRMRNPREGFQRRLRRIYPDGLAGRSVLDCGCNCGAYLFYAKELGAGPGLAFDARRHWIDQARFIARHMPERSEDVRFEVADLYELPGLAPGEFDVTFFLGLFYHLPEPVTGLKLAAERTRELLILNTATRAGLPDGQLVADYESPDLADAGLHGLCWFPTGPAVLGRILGWLGFPEVRCSVWRRAPNQRRGLDRVEVLAARSPGYFDAWDSGRPPGAAGLAEAIETGTPPGATVLVVGDRDDLPPLRDRTAIPLAADRGALGRLQASGAGYLAVPASARERLGEAQVSLGAQVNADRDCAIYALAT